MSDFFNIKCEAKHNLFDLDEEDSFLVFTDNRRRFKTAWHIGSNNKYMESLLKFHQLQEGKFNEDPTETVDRLMELKQFCADIIAQTDEKLIAYKASVEEAREILDAKFEEDIRQLTLDGQLTLDDITNTERPEIL